MQSYRIVLEYTSSSEGVNSHSHPETWDWWEMLDIGVDETLSVMSVEDIETPDAHIAELADDAPINGY